MTKHPSVARPVSFDALANKYGAHDFVMALQRFVVQYQQPKRKFTGAEIDALANALHVDFFAVHVFHRLKWRSQDASAMDPLAEAVVDSIHVEPNRRDKYGNLVPGRFDTAIINVAEGGEASVKGILLHFICLWWNCTETIFLGGYCVGQIRCLFILPKKARARWFPAKFPHDHFAYVEWFTPFSSSRFDRHSKMYRVSRLYNPANKGGHRKASIIPVSLIRASIHLFPKFGAAAPADWRSSNVSKLHLLFMSTHSRTVSFTLPSLIFVLYLLQFILIYLTVLLSLKICGLTHCLNYVFQYVCPILVLVACEI